MFGNCSLLIIFTNYPLAHNQTTILIIESEKCTTDHKSEEDERLKRQRGGDGARAGDGQWQGLGLGGG